MRAEHKQERSTSEMLHPMRYKIRPGTVQFGKTYEIKIMTLLSLRCALESDQGMWIASNVPNVGAFDDVVIHHGNVTFLMQLKHRENRKPILRQELEGARGDFSLLKYFKDVVQLKNYLDTKDNKPEFVDYLGEFSSLRFIIFSNRDVDNYEFLQKSSNKSLKFINTSVKGKIHKVDSSKLSDILNNFDCDKDIYLLTNQVSAKNVDQQIQDQIEKIIVKFNLVEVSVKDVAEKFNEYITEWADGNFGLHYCLTRTEILRKLSELLLGQYEKDLRKETFSSSISDNKVFIWNQIMDNNHLTVVNYDKNTFRFLIDYISREVLKYCTESVSSWSSNFTTSAQSAFYQNHVNLKPQMLKITRNRNRITAIDIYKCLWLTGKLPLLLVITNQEHYDGVLQILKLCGYCYKVILINKSDKQVRAQNCGQSIKQFFTLEDLNEADKSAVLNTTVALQGRFHIALQHLIDESIFHLINCNDIINILLNNFSIGNYLEPSLDYFIQRRVSKVFIKFEVLDKIRDEKFIIEGDYENHFKISNLQHFNVKKFEDFDFSTVEAQRIRITSNSDSDQRLKGNLKQLTSEIVHHLRIYDKEHFEWIASFGSTKNIKRFLVHLEDTIDNNMLSKGFSKLTLLSGPSGIGKTTLMNYIACNMPSNKWVLKIDLNFYMEYCKQHKVKMVSAQASEHLKYFNDFCVSRSNCNVKLANAVFEKLRASKDIVVLLDGFDEVSVLYKEEVTNIIKRLYTDNYYMLLTTRPHMEAYLEEQFNTFAITLKSFSLDDQRQFLLKYFSFQDGNLNSGLHRNYLQDFSEKLLQVTRRNLSDMDATFTGIPLQSRLLADAFFEDCKKFVLSKGKHTIKENFDLLHLYRNFVNNKIDILCSKFGSSSAEMFTSLKNLHFLHALKLLFALHKDIITYVEKHINFNYTNTPEEASLLQKAGIVTFDKNLNVSFTHRTFSEYLAAQWLAENFSNPDQNIRECVKILYNERFTQNYRFLFIMFDHIVAEECPLHLYIINGKTDNVHRAVRLGTNSGLVTDKCKRSILHVLGLYGIRYPPLYKNNIQTKEAQMLLSSESFDKDGALDILNIIPTDTITAVEVDVFSYSPLDYALASCSLTVANKLYTKLDISTVNISIDLNRKGDYLGYCALQNYKRLFKVLLIYFATKDFFMNRVNGNTFVKSYYHRVFTGYDFQKDKILNYINKFKFKTILQLILTQGPKVFPWFNDHNFNLHISVIFDSRKEVCRLIQLGVDVNKRDNDYNTPLHYAILHKNTEIFNTLLQNGANVNQHNLEKNTPLHFAVIAHDYSSKQDRNFFNNLKIHFGTKTSSSDKMIIELISKGASINLLNSDGNTPLHLALLHKNEYLSELFLFKNSEANLENKNGENCLHLAAFHGFKKIVLKLLSVGVDIYKHDKRGDTPLHHAIINNKVETANLLISMGADPNITNNYGRNCLHVASYYGYTNIMSEILPIIKDIDQQDKDSYTAIQLALQQNKLDTVKLLISKGADANAQIASGQNSLHVASCEGHIELASQVLPFIKSINQQDHEGFTPLQLAVQQNKLDIVKLLISKGADPNIRNKSGRNCLHEASCGKHPDIASVVMPLIRDINQPDNEGFTSLQLAVQQNKTEIVKLLISKGADPIIRNKSGRNCLHEASCGGHTGIATELLFFYGDINQQDNEGFTPLQLAVQQNKSDIVELLISKGADSNIRNKSGRNCLHEASCGGHVDIAAELLLFCMDVNQQDNEGFTPLQLAVQQNKPDIVKLLITKGADPNIRNNSGRNCLHEASCGGHIDIAAELLVFYGDVNQQDNEGFTPLQLAVQQNKPDLVELLISKGADPNIRNKSGRNCLHEASCGGHVDIAARLLLFCKDINQQDNEGCTPLQLAVQQNKPDIVKVLISKDADPNIRNKSGRNCLHEASCGGHVDIAAELLLFNGDINQQDNEGFTSLQLAVQQNKPDIVELLISKGADPNIRNKSGRNCLHEASCGGHVDIAARLLLFCKDINQQDNEGCTPLQLAVQQNKPDIVKLLISKGADPNIRNKSGRNCLHEASCGEHPDITAVVLPLIWDINQLDNEDLTSLQLAVQQNKSDIAKLLISKGANPNLQDNSGAYTDIQANLAS